MIPDDCNYVELIITKNKECFNIDDELFAQLLKKVKHHKYFEKEYKVYQYNDLCFENQNNIDYKVYSRHIVDVKYASDLAVCMCKKSKHPFHAFPSTTSLDAVFYVKKLVFRLHNRLYLNFECQYYPKNETIIRKVYINYNHEKQVDATLIEQIIAKTLTMLGLPQVSIC